jgi:flagellar biosynthesis/type III secretory pathway protein FliH
MIGECRQSTRPLFSEAVLAQVLRLIWMEPEPERRWSYLRVTLRYSVAGGRLKKDAIGKALESALPEGEKQTMSNWLDDLIEEGYYKGKEEGREEGRVAGREDGRQEAKDILYQNLLRLLHHRFGEIPETVTEQLAPLSLAQIGSLMNTALEADSLDEFMQTVQQIQ